MARALVRELLRPRALQVHVVAVAFLEGFDHVLGGAGVHQDRVLHVQPLPVAGVLEHRHRLRAVVDDQLAAFQVLPAELRLRRAPEEEKAVHLVDLREVQGRRRLALLERPETLRGRGLGDVHRAVHEARDRRGAGLDTECWPRSPSCSRKPPAMVAMSGE